MIEKYMHYNLLTGFHNTVRAYIDENVGRYSEQEKARAKLEAWEGNVHRFLDVLLYGPEKLKFSQQKYYRVWSTSMEAWLPIFFFEMFRTTDPMKIYEQTENGKAVLKAYDDWMADKRRKFRLKTDLVIQKATDGKAATGKPAPSHGGIANLLRVLTRNMEQRHRPLMDIAKVQYAVCVQAGVYLPEEFMEDVMILDDVIGEQAQEETA